MENWEVVVCESLGGMGGGMSSSTTTSPSFFLRRKSEKEPIFGDIVGNEWPNDERLMCPVLTDWPVLQYPSCLEYSYSTNRSDGQRRSGIDTVKSEKGQL